MSLEAVYLHALEFDALVDMPPIRILFIAAHRPDRAPGQRYRFEQYFNHLTANGFTCELSYFITEADDKLLYASGNYFKKALIQWRSIRKRKQDVERLKKGEFDLVFIYREALLTGSIRFEKAFKKTKTKIIYDFDDAIWHLDVSNANQRLSWLKRPQKTHTLFRLADLIFAGNSYLAEYARRYNKEVRIIPTTIDTDFHRPDPSRRNKDVLTIGWSGSITTIKHFESALDCLRIIKRKYGDRICFAVMGDAGYSNSELGIQGIAWSSQTEVDTLNTFDIGIMPLPDDEWAKGKCGLKGLSYMALEIPTIMSPVGVNTAIIQDGENGFLASTLEEWVEKISKLIESEELRQYLGKEARKTVLERYSVVAYKHVYEHELRELSNVANPFPIEKKRLHDIHR